MNTRSIAMIAILAVAAVAIVGAGYAYYWGQTEIENNNVDVKYIGVQTDFKAVDIDVDFNTKYAKIGTEMLYTLTTTPGFADVAGKNVTPITRNTAGTAAEGVAFTLSAPTDVSGYHFQVKLTGVEIGSNAKLYFGYSDAKATAPTELVEFYPTSTVEQGTPIEYVATPAELDLEADGVGYSATKYGFIYLEEKDANSASGVQVAVSNIKNVKCNITSGTLTYQAMLESGNSVTGTTVQAGTGFTATVTSDYATLVDGKVTAITGLAKGTYYIPVKFTNNTTAADYEYLLAELTVN